MTHNSATGTLSPRLTTDDLDEIARHLAREIIEGGLDEAEGRMQILEAVHRSGLVRTATLEWCSRSSLGRHLWDDMMDLAEKFFRDKILILEETEQAKADPDRFISMAVLAGEASISGAIRQALRSVMLMERTLLRRALRIHRNEFVSLDYRPPGTTQSTLADTMADRRDAETDAIDPADGQVRGAVLLLDHERRVRSARGPARLAARAETVRQMYGLPRPLRPLDPSDRAAISAWITAAPERALASVKALLRGKSGDEADATIAQVWADYHHDHLEEIVSTRAPEPVAELLVLDAVQNLGRPSEVTRRRVIQYVKALLSGSGKPATWAADLVEAFIAAECEGSAAPERAMVYRSMLAQATRLAGRPLGEDRMAVRDRLIEITQPRSRTTSPRRMAAAA